MSKSP